MKRCLYIILVVFCLGNLSYSKAKILFTKGSVQKKDRQGRWSTAKQGQVIAENVWLKTGKKSAVVIELAKKSKVKLGENSVLQIRSIRKFKKNIHLQKGSFLAKIKKLGGNDRYNISSPTAIVGVRGTFLYGSVVGTGAKAKSLFCVKEGVINVTGKATQETVSVAQGMGTQVAASTAPVKPKAVNWIKQINWTMSVAVPISTMAITPLSLLPKGGAGVPSVSGVPTPSVPSVPSIGSGTGGGDKDDDEKAAADSDKEQEKAEEEKEKEEKEKEEGASGKIGLSLRLYGAFGSTQLSKPENISTDLDQFNWRVGLQLKYDLFDLSLLSLGIGVDLAYMRLFDSGSVSVDTDAAATFNTLAFVELELLGFIIVQGGGGMYWGLGSYNDNDFGFMLAAGIEIPLGSTFAIPIMLRCDIILGKETLYPISGMTGLAFKF